MQKQKRVRHSTDPDPWKIAYLNNSDTTRKLFDNLNQRTAYLESTLNRLPKAKKVKLTRKMLNITDKILAVGNELDRWEKEYEGSL